MKGISLIGADKKYNDWLRTPASIHYQEVWLFGSAATGNLDGMYHLLYDGIDTIAAESFALSIDVSDCDIPQPDPGSGYIKQPGAVVFNETDCFIIGGINRWYEWDVDEAALWNGTFVDGHALATGRCYKFNLASKTYTRIANMPNGGGTNGSGILVGNYIYVTSLGHPRNGIDGGFIAWNFYGFYPTSQNALNVPRPWADELWRYNIPGNSWELLGINPFFDHLGREETTLSFSFRTNIAYCEEDNCLYFSRNRAKYDITLNTWSQYPFHTNENTGNISIVQHHMFLGDYEVNLLTNTKKRVSTYPSEAYTLTTTNNVFTHCSYVVENGGTEVYWNFQDWRTPQSSEAWIGNEATTKAPRLLYTTSYHEPFGLKVILDA